MRITDMLKPKTETINDGSTTYDFTPGKEASLIVKGKDSSKIPLTSKPMKRSKMILPKETITIGATRG